MSDLVIIIPSRGRPGTVRELAEAFRDTCTADTELVFSVDDDDLELGAYQEAAAGAREVFAATQVYVHEAPGNMVASLNLSAAQVLQEGAPDAVGFFGDDHRPRTAGWDTAYGDALKKRPGFVYGNDLLRGADLPTQVAITTAVVRALGHMAPPFLKHMYVDNYWIDLGKLAEAITYLPEVIVEHLHPAAGKSEGDASYERTSEFFGPDAAAYEANLPPAEMQRLADLVRAAADGA